jgi:uncharacterized protein YjbI with pentapeptide repeats
VRYRGSHAHLTGRSLIAARLCDVVLDRSDLDGIQLEDAVMEDVSMQQASLLNAVIRNARVVGGSFAGSAMNLCVFDGASLSETDLRSAQFDRSSWMGTKAIATMFDDARFGNANLDGGRFIGCTFRRADFRPRVSQIPAATRAIFEDCDLRSTQWDGRDVAGAVFIRCRFAGVIGKPLGTRFVTIVDPDLSFDGNGSFIGTADDVLDDWL